MSSKTTNGQSNSKSSGEEAQERIKATALRHALEIEAKKKLQSRVSDLAYKAFDLPSSVVADPAEPSNADLSLFLECLRYFRPEDLDDLVDERNIDNRCGYALCPKRNKKLEGRGAKAWNGKTGGDFGFVDKAEKERWCSKLCGQRNDFVRRQLKKEPAWLRDAQNTEVDLLDNVNVGSRSAETADNASLESVEEGANARLDALRMERGEVGAAGIDTSIPIVEKETTDDTRPPQLAQNETIEGLPSRITEKGRMIPQPRSKKS